MGRRLTRATLTSGKVTLSLPHRRRALLKKVQTLAEREGKSVSEKVWEMVDQALEGQGQRKVSFLKGDLPAADLGRILVTDREGLYDDILAHRL